MSWFRKSIKERKSEPEIPKEPETIFSSSPVTIHTTPGTVWIPDYTFHMTHKQLERVLGAFQYNRYMALVKSQVAGSDSFQDVWKFFSDPYEEGKLRLEPKPGEYHVQGASGGDGNDES